jgi:large subunit ribosomal protein L17
MRHRKKGRRLGVNAAHRRSMLANMASSLIEHGAINTTDARARQLRMFIEPMITLAKRGDLHARRNVLSHLRNQVAVKRLFDELAPQLTSDGGYTRILKLGRRKGDSAAISMIQFAVPEQETAPAVVPAEDEAAVDSAVEDAQEG